MIEGVKLIPKNVNEFYIEFPTGFTTIRNNDNITEVKYNGSKLELGEKYILQSGDYKISYTVNKIVESQKYPRLVKCIENEYNTATLFVLPLLFKSRLDASYVIDNYGYLSNCYIQYKNNGSKYSVFVLLKYVRSQMFKEREEFFLKQDHFSNKYDIGPDFVMYEFVIPDEHKDAYKAIRRGKYSRICGNSRNAIVRFHGVSPESEIVRSVIDKDPKLIAIHEEKLGLDFNQIGDFELYKRLGKEDEYN